MPKLGLGQLGDAEPGSSTLTENLRWSIDLAARAIFDDKLDEWHSAFFVGLDLHKVFSSSHGDWGHARFTALLNEAR